MRITSKQANTAKLGPLQPQQGSLWYTGSICVRYLRAGRRAAEPRIRAAAHSPTRLWHSLHEQKQDSQ